MVDDKVLVEALRHRNPWWTATDRGPNTGVERDLLGDLERWLGQPAIIAVTGMRTAGKSTLMLQLVQRLLRTVPPTDIFFLNLEDPQLLALPQGIELLERLFQACVASLKPTGVPYVFLDEVQVVPDWAQWARHAMETGRAHVAVTGSTSHVLAPQLATVLTGRTITRTLWPLSFGELVRLHAQEPGRRLSSSATDDLEGYLRLGGLPGVRLLPDESMQEEALKQRFRDILQRDVVSRHGVRTVDALERFAQGLLFDTGNLATFNKLKNKHGLAMDQCRNYVQYLVECHLIHLVDKLAFKASEQIRAPRKVFATDTGLRNAVSFRFSEDRGRLMETVVACELLRDQDARVYHLQEDPRGECDFVVWRGASAEEAIQVCASAELPLPAREEAGLRKAMASLSIRRGTLITGGVGRRIVPTDEGEITFIGIREWLLERGGGRGPGGRNGNE